MDDADHADEAAANDWAERDRVRMFATTICEPRSAAWVAARADVDIKTARRVLEDLVDRDELDRTIRNGDTLYHLIADHGE